MSNVKLTVNRSLIDGLQSRIEAGLESVGLTAEGYAKMECPVDTGNLRNSITHAIQGNTVHIGTNSSYAPYVEYGTGRFSETGGGTIKDSWVYQDALGRYHRAFPQKPRPFIRPAVSNHLDEYKRIIEDALKG